MAGMIAMVGRMRWAGGAAAGATAATLLLAGCEQTTVSVLEVATVEVEPDRIVLMAGELDSAVAVVRERGGRVLAGRSVRWSSDDDGVAVVDDAGVIEGRAPGSTVVRAIAEGVEGTAEVTVQQPPTLALTRDELTLQGVAGDPAPVQAEVEVRNAGAGSLGDLSVEVRGEQGAADPGWLEAVLLDPEEPARLRLRARAEALGPGTHLATVQVAATEAVNSPVSLAVRLEVAEPPPELHVEPTSVSLGAVAGAHTPATHTVEVRNRGGGTLEPIRTLVRYPPGQLRGWLDVAEPDPPRAPTELTLRASSRHLPPGEYTGWVEVSSPAAPGQTVEVEVSFTVTWPFGLASGEPASSGEGAPAPR